MQKSNKAFSTILKNHEKIEAAYAVNQFELTRKLMSI